MASDAEPGISIEVVGVVRDAIATLGFDVGELATSSGGLVVPGPIADALFDRAAAALGDAALGLSVAERIPIGSLGVIDYGLCTASDLREALGRVTRYYAVATQRARLELVEGGAEARLVFHRLPGLTHSGHWIEFAFAMIATRIRQTVGLGDGAFTSVRFRHPGVAGARHREFFGTAVEFEASADWLGFDARWLDRRLVTASRTLADLLDHRLRELAPALATTDAYIDRVRRMLVTMLDDRLTDVDTLASRIGTSRRTLQRGLAERGTSHTKLLDELRRERAAELLERGLSITEVAHRIGFADPSAFFRAYRKWTGTSPRSTRSS